MKIFMTLSGLERTILKVLDISRFYIQPNLITNLDSAQSNIS